MTPRPGTTDELHPGMYFRVDPVETAYRVDARSSDHVVVTDQHRNRTRWELPATPEPCTILEPTEAEALDVVTSRLGAEVVGEREAPRTTWKIPPLGNALGKWRHHLFLFHGQWANDKGSDLRTCREFHALDHDDSGPSGTSRARGYVHHEH